MIPSVVVYTRKTNVREMLEDHFKYDVVKEISYEENFAVVSFKDIQSSAVVDAFVNSLKEGGKIIVFENSTYVITPQHLDI
jgi:hypothetical protein